MTQEEVIAQAFAFEMGVHTGKIRTTKSGKPCSTATAEKVQRDTQAVLMARLVHAFKVADVVSSGNVLQELCQRFGEAKAVELYNRAHMRVYPLWRRELSRY